MASVKQNAPVHDSHGFGFQPSHHDAARWPAQIGESEARLDGGKLIVAGRRSPREVGDDACIHSDLFGDVVEHDCRQQLACAQMSPRIAQAAELQGIAQAGRRSACEADRSKVLGIEAMMSHHRRLAVGQSKQRGALPLGHRNTCGHVSSSKNLLPFVGLVKEDCERPKAAEIGACCFRLQIRPFVKETQMTREPYLIGYARVSKGDDQSNAAQRRALDAAGCKRVFEETASGGRWDRPKLLEMIGQLRDGDVVVVWKLDRLSRSLKDMLHIMERIELAGAGFRSLTEAIDTTTAAGRMMMQMVGSFAEFERAMIRERTSAGLAQARAEGRIGGRRPKLGDKQRREIAESVTSGRKSGAEMARLYGVSEPTVSRIVAAHRQQFSQQQREQA
jgi:DNA invertase Pin-like site-specific DNA recombinase